MEKLNKIFNSLFLARIDTQQRKQKLN